MLEVLRYIALNTVQKIKAMSKMSKTDKVHIRDVRLCVTAAACGPECSGK